jgi:hypothetical protein
MRHPKPKTPVNCNNTMAIGIANNSIKKQHSWSMEMLFFWLGDKIAQNMYDLSWHPGQEPGVPPCQCKTVVFTNGKFSPELTPSTET